jgi:hypothetical protein
VDLKLPGSVASRRDVIRLHREVRIFFDSVEQSIMRHENPVRYPGISEHLRAVALDNQIDLKDLKKCQQLIDDLDLIKDKAPSVHVSFPTEPTPEIMQKLVEWFRQEIDQHIVIQVGMQPTIAAGIILRTPNKQFDFSLRKHLYQNRHKLAEAINSVR